MVPTQRATGRVASSQGAGRTPVVLPKFQSLMIGVALRQVINRMAPGLKEDFRAAEPLLVAYQSLN